MVVSYLAAVEVGLEYLRGEAPGGEVGDGVAGVGNRIIAFRGEGHFSHPQSCVVKVRRVGTAWWLMMVSELNGAAVEV